VVTLLLKWCHTVVTLLQAIDAEGYFRSGDIGKMEGGFVYILDRMKDIIIRGGENIDCAEVSVVTVLSQCCQRVFTVSFLQRMYYSPNV
jgi:long-subunit acyl-CoA synthetase (AMP-forming)